MIMELLGHTNYLRILMAVKRKPLRFTDIQKALDLNPNEVERALTFLRNGLWIIPRTLRAKRGRIHVEYSLGNRGAAFLKSFEAFQKQAKRREADLGKSEVAELQRLST